MALAHGPHSTEVAHKALAATGQESQDLLRLAVTISAPVRTSSTGLAPRVQALTQLAGEREIFRVLTPVATAISGLLLLRVLDLIDIITDYIN